MKLNFETPEWVKLSEVKYGDVLILANGSKWLIVADEDGTDFRGVNLETFRTSDWAGSVSYLVDSKLDGDAVTKVIKSEYLVLGVI